LVYTIYQLTIVFSGDYLYHHQGNPPEEFEWFTEDCPALKKEFPDFIVGSYHYSVSTAGRLGLIFAPVGFNLVGPEDTTKPIIDYIVPLFHFKDRQKELGLDISFIFHTRETLGDGTAADDSLYDAILLRTKRIGYG